MSERCSTLAACLLLAACSAPRPSFAPVDYPPTTREDVVDDYHGTPVADPYRWLEDDRAPATEAWVAVQNELTEGVLATIPAREDLRARLTELWNTERREPPAHHGEVWSWTRNDGLQPQNVLVVAARPEAEARVLLDPNTWSADGTVALAGASFSDDGRFVAYGTSEGGSDWSVWRVRDVRTAADLPEQLAWVKFSTPAWMPDGSGFFYARFPAPEGGAELSSANLHQKVWFHALGTPQSADRLVYEDPGHPERGFAATPTQDGRWLVLLSWQGSASERALHVRPLHDAGAPFVALDDSWENNVSYVGNDGDLFYVQTDAGAPHGRIVGIDLSRPSSRHWTNVVPETGDALQAGSLFGDTLVLVYLHDAHDAVVRVDLRTAARSPVDLPGLGSVGGLSGRREDGETYVSFSSFTQPQEIWHLDVASGATRLAWAPEVAFDREAFVTEQVFVTSRDGTRVPMFLVRRADVRPDGDRPVYLYGYGGFDISLTPAFKADYLPFLERGGIFAQPNLRGGGEYGQAWHEAGILEKKQNVFDDFIAAAEWLVEEGWTRPGLIAIGGRSNGGLLVGAALTQRPELFGCAVPGVGVLDMLRYHRFTIGSRWASEYGRSDDPAHFAFLYAYSPLHHIEEGTEYPPTLVLTADHDDRVVPAHSFKFGAALQAAQGCEAPVLLRVETRAGHGAGKPVSMRIAEAADTWAFVLRALGQA